MPLRQLAVSLIKVFHAALLRSTLEQKGTCEGRFVSRGTKLRVSGCILTGEFRGYPDGYMDGNDLKTRDGTCQSLQRA